MKTSVIIPTFNGAKKIPNLLASLKGQTIAPDEILIIIDGSTDDTQQVVEGFSKSMDNIRIISQVNMGRAVAKNTGIEKATGELLIFFDDDIRAQADNIERHIKFHQQYKNAMLVSRVTLDESKIKEDFSRFRSELEVKWVQPFASGLQTISLKNYGFTSANLSCSKSLIQQLNGFDSQLRDSEDFEFSLRAIIADIPIYYDYFLVAWHDDYVPIRSYIKRQVEYILSKQQLAKLKPEMVQLHPSSFDLPKIGNKKIVRSLFVLNKFWNTILYSRLYSTMLPKKVRYKLYDLITFCSVSEKLDTPNDKLL